MLDEGQDDMHGSLSRWRHDFLTAVTVPPFKFTNHLKTAKYLHFFVLLIPHIHDAMKFFTVLHFQSCTRGHHCSAKSQTGFSN